MLPFLFWVQKMPKNGCKYFLHLDKFMDYNEVWFSRSTFYEKASPIQDGLGGWGARAWYQAEDC